MKKFYRVMLILFAIHFAVALTIGIVFLIKYRAIPEADPGDQYYLVYYGNKHIKTYDASVYVLPQ